MFQIIFNELSAAEISSLPKKLQLELLAQFQILPADLDQLDSERFGVIEREGKKLYRYRAKDYRIYFAKTDEGIKVNEVKSSCFMQQTLNQRSAKTLIPTFRNNEKSAQPWVELWTDFQIIQF